MNMTTTKVSLATVALLLSAGLCIGQPSTPADTTKPAAGHASGSQPAASASNTPSAPADRAQMAVLKDERISLKFSGGSLADYVAALKSLPGNAALNIVLNNGAEKAEVPPFSFTQVSPMVALQILEEIAAIPSGIVINPFGGEGSSGGEPIWVISARERPRRPEEFMKTSVFSLGFKPASALEPAAATSQEQHITTLLSAVEAALSLSSDQAPQLKFHRESGLLIVRGTSDDENVVREVIKELSKPEREKLVSDISAKLAALSLDEAKLEREDKAIDEELSDARKMVRDIDNQNRADVDRNERDAHVLRIQSLSARQDAIRERLMSLQQQRNELLDKSSRAQ
jgi:hypothetical protein